MNIPLTCLAVSTALLLVAFGWSLCNDLKDRKAEREQAKRKIAESACEELRKQVMRGSTIAHLARNSAHSKADHDVEVVIIADKPHAFTDSVLPRARTLYTYLVDSGQIRPLQRLK